MHAQDKREDDARPDSSGKVVPLILTDAQRDALHQNCVSVLYGVLNDLEHPEIVRDPVATAREGEVFRRLLEALADEQITIPDEEMRARMERLSESYDETENAEEVIATHYAHQALLRVLTGSGDEETGGSPGPRWIPGDDADCRREILDLLLKEESDCLEFDEIAIALAGDSEDQSERNSLREAVQALVGAGLLCRRSGAFAATRSARQMAVLGFSIG
jgi:hypothetical protein